MMKPYAFLAILSFMFVGFLQLPPVAQAQLSQIKTGDVVRINAPHHTQNILTGRVREISRSSIQIELLNSDANLFEISFNDIEQLELRKLKTKRGRGALTGAVSGAIIGGVLFSVAGSSDSSSDDSVFFDEPIVSQGALLAGGVIIGGLTGGIIGTIVGNNIREFKWKTIHFEPAADPLTIRYIQLSPKPGFTVRVRFKR